MEGEYGMQITENDVELINYDNYTALTNIESVMRTCYQSISKNNPQKFVEMLINKNHISSLEHYTFSVRIVTDRSTANQIVRHRLASYAQESQRYINYTKKDLMFIKPCRLVNGSVWAEACTAAEKYYVKLIELGEKPELARSVLNMSTKTEIVMTSNLRNFIHFINTRNTVESQETIRRIAKKLKQLLIEESGWLETLFD